MISNSTNTSVTRRLTSTAAVDTLMQIKPYIYIRVSQQDDPKVLDLVARAERAFKSWSNPSNLALVQYSEKSGVYSADLCLGVMSKDGGDGGFWTEAWDMPALFAKAASVGLRPASLTVGVKSKLFKPRMLVAGFVTRSK